MNWLALSWHKGIIVLLALERLWERAEPLIERLQKRAKGGRMIDPLKYIKLIPVLERLSSDLEKDINSPESKAVSADVKELIADLKGGN